MDGRDLVRAVGMGDVARLLRDVRLAWRRRRDDATAFPRRGVERARVPGTAQSAQARPGGGLILFERSSLRIRVAVGGAVFCGWDGADMEPSHALDGSCPAADERAKLEPDKDGGWRVVSERVMVTVSRRGAVEVSTPGGVVLRRDLPPRWWETTVGAASTHWIQHSRVASDARFFGLGGVTAGPRPHEGSHRLWNGPLPFPRLRGRVAPGPSVAMPVQLVVADVGTHLVFHDNTWDGGLTLREGEEGAGSGHDRAGRCTVRMAGGPLRYWVITGVPARVLRGWASLTGGAALPPSWALGYQHAVRGLNAPAELRRLVDGYHHRDLPLRALHLDPGHHPASQERTMNQPTYVDLTGLASGPSEEDVRLVSIVEPTIAAEAGEEPYEGGAAADVFVRDRRGREVRGAVPAARVVFPDVTDGRVRKWWGRLQAEHLTAGFSGVAVSGNDPTRRLVPAALPLSARHSLDGRGGSHREAHNVYVLDMAKAVYEACAEVRPHRRPFVLARTGWAGTQRYGGVVPGGITTDWEGLRACVALVLALGLCGIPYTGADIGGATRWPSAELYLRWFQLGSWLPLFRTHTAEATGPQEPWRFGSDVLEHVRAALARRERLLPYFVTLAHVARHTGAPYVRPLWWHHSRDRALRGCEDAFLLGGALLVAPVLEQGATRRTVRLPRGSWYDTATGERYEGPARVVLNAPLAGIPVLARAGAAIPVTADDGRTELEVWSPAPGHTGKGLVVTDSGDGWQPPHVERLTVQRSDGRLDVRREDGEPTGYPVRVRA